MPSTSSWSITQRDYDGEPTTTVFGLAQLTDVNIITILPQLGPLKTAIDGVTLGLLTGTNLTWAADVLGPPGGVASSVNAQRENKWLIRYFDTVTNRPFQVSLGCADLALLSGNSDTINLRDGATPAPPAAFVAFKTAFETVVQSPDGNPVKTLSAQHVGRNT